MRGPPYMNPQGPIGAPPNMNPQGPERAPPSMNPQGPIGAPPSMNPQSPMITPTPSTKSKWKKAASATGKVKHSTPMVMTIDEFQELHNDLEKNFKPIFDTHGAEGIPIGRLRTNLESKGLMETVKWTRAEEILAKADKNADKHLTYQEFYKMMTCELTAEEREPMKRVMRAAIADLVPRRMREDFLANYNCTPPPIFIPVISLLQIGIFVFYMSYLEKRGIETTALSGFPLDSPFIYNPRRRYEIWRFFTHMFVHKGYVQLTYNVVQQTIFGLSLELVHKWWRVGLIYCLGVVTGCLIHSVTELNLHLVGADGGVQAMVAAHVAAILLNWREMNFGCCDPNELMDHCCFGICRWLLLAPVRLAIIVVLAAPNTILAIHRRIEGAEEFRVGICGQVGGYVTGLFLGVVILRNINVEMWERKLGIVMLLWYLMYFIFCIFFNVYWPGYLETDWSDLDF